MAADYLSYQSLSAVVDNLRSYKYTLGSHIISNVLSRCIKHQQRIFLRDSYRNQSVIVSDSASTMYLINELCELHRYEIKISKENDLKIEVNKNLSLKNTHCSDARRFNSPDTIAYISVDHLRILNFNGTQTVRKSFNLGSSFMFSQFAQEPARSFIIRPEDWCRRKRVLLFNKDTVILAPRSLGSSDITQPPYYRLHRQSKITAVGVATAFEESRNICIYIAKGSIFSLLPLKATKRKTGLIDFASTSNMSEIFHLQCLLSANNDRKGILLRRKDGQVEFWDDRQPKGPVVVYHNSLIHSAASKAARPVVDFPQQSYVAASTDDHRVIRLWELKTGELMNSLQGPHYELLDDFPSPPILSCRSFWGFDGQYSSFQGLTLLSVKKNVFDFYF